MEPSTACEANSTLATEEFINTLRNPKVHHCVHKSSQLVPILGRINPFHSFCTLFLRLILILSSHLRVGLPNGLFPSGLPTKTLYSHALPCVLHILPVTYSST
jgi:hypothetical protein